MSPCSVHYTHQGKCCLLWKCRAANVQMYWEANRNWSQGDTILNVKAMNSLLLHSLFFYYNPITFVCLPGHLNWLKVHKHPSRPGVWRSSSLWTNAEGMFQKQEPPQANLSHLSEKPTRQTVRGKEVERQYHGTEECVKTFAELLEICLCHKMVMW